MPPQLEAPRTGIGDWFVGVKKSSKQASSDAHVGLSVDAGFMDLMNVFNDDDLHFFRLEVDLFKVNMDGGSHQTADAELKNKKRR